MIKEDSKKKYLFLSLLFLIIVIIAVPKIVSSLRGVSDTFAFANTGLAYDEQNNNRIPFAPYPNTGNTINRHANSISNDFFPTVLITTLSDFTGIPLKDLQFLPLMGLILSFVAYVLARRLLNSNIFALTFAIFISYEPVTNHLTYNFFTHSWGIIIYFLFILMFIVLIEEWDQKNKGSMIPAVLSLFLLFIAASFTYITAEFYIVVLIFIVLAALIILPRLKRIDLMKRYHIMKSKRLLVGVLIISAVFVIINIPTLASILGRIAQLLQFSGSAPASPYLISGTVSRIDATLALALYLIILVPIALYLTYLLGRFRRFGRIQIDLKDIFIGAIIITGVLEFLVYLGWGFANFRFILLIFPLISMIAIERLAQRRSANAYDKNHGSKKLSIQGGKRRHIYHQFFSYVIVILLLFLVIFRYHIKISEEDDKRYYSTNFEMNWIVDHIDIDNYKVLSNLLHGEKLFVESTSSNHRRMDIIMFTDETVEFLYVNNSTLALETMDKYEVGYLVITEEDINDFIGGGSWRNFRPLGNVINNLNAYDFLIKIFDDGDTIIYAITSG
jgi:hypothetical protein